MPVTEDSSLSLDQRVTRVETNLEGLSRDVVGLRAHTDAGFSGLHSKLDAFNTSLSQSQRPKPELWFAGVTVLFLLGGAAYVPIWLTSSNLKESIVELRGTVKEGFAAAKAERDEIERRQFDHITSPGHPTATARFDALEKQWDEFRRTTDARFVDLDDKLQRETKLQTDAVVNQNQALDVRLQREMRLRDKIGPESAMIGD